MLNTFKFNHNELFSGLITATLFSSFIYIEHFNINILFVNSIIAIYSFYRIFKANQARLMIAGFFIGLFWFYWVGFSFIYVDMIWMVPFISLIFALIFSLTFWLIGFATKIYFRLPLIFLLSFYDPFYFNWFRPELLLVNSYFGLELWQYALFLSSIALFVYFQKYRLGFLALFLLFFTINYETKQTKFIPFDVKIEQTTINQKKKWLIEEQDSIINMNLKKIRVAIKEKRELIILPESSLPIYLNLHLKLQNELKNLSQYIDIVIGALYFDKNSKPFNATYYFTKKKVHLALKMILVPFGEYVPLPKFIRKYINNLIFQGAKDYSSALAPTDFNIKGIKVRSAICYEATSELFFKGDVNYIIAISNNGWFEPSIEPTLQKLLIKLYAKRHNVTVLHSVNNSKSYIIYP